MLKLNIEGEKLQRSHRMTDASQHKDLLQKYNDPGSVLLLAG